MKKMFVMCFIIFGLICNSLVVTFALESQNDGIYVAEKKLNQEEMANIFLAGYHTIIAYDNNPKSRTSGTHSITTCTQMKKRAYDWIGYSKQCFHETYTSVYLTSPDYSLSLGYGGISFSIPVSSSKRGSDGGVIGLTDAEKNRIKNNNCYSCIRLKGFSTWAKYSSKIYSNTTGSLLQTTSYTYTYTFKNNQKPGLDYHHTVSNPSKASLLPWV